VTNAGATHHGRLLLVLNGGADSGKQLLPAGQWRLMLDTARPDAEEDSVTGAIHVAGFSLVLLEHGRATSRGRAP